MESFKAKRGRKPVRMKFRSYEGITPKGFRFYKKGKDGIYYVKEETSA